MAKKYLDYDGLLYFWQKIKTVFVPNTRKVNGKALSADITLTASDVSALPSSTTIPSPGTGSSYPAMDGTRALGSNAGYARVDHVHPSDTSRVPTSRTINGFGLGADVTLTGDDIAITSGDPTSIKEAFDNEGTYVRGLISGKVDKVDGKGLSTNDYTTTEKNKLAAIASGAEVNQNAFSNVKVGSTTVAADTKTDTLELVAGSNITLTPDATNDKVTIAAANTTYSDFTAPTSSVAGTHGLVPAPVAAELNNVLFSDAKWYELDTTRDGTVVEVTRREAGQSSTEVLLTIPAATTAAAGVMTSSDKTKLNGIASGAEVNQNAFSNVTVGSTTVSADSKTDTLTLAGSNVTLTPDASADKVTIGITASNVTTALGNTAVARATGDASGNNIASTYAPKESPTFSGTPIAPTATAGTNSTQIATTAFVTSAIQTAQAGAATFQGTAPTSFAPTGYKKGYYWVVGTAGTYAGQTCEPGDMIFAVEDYASAYAAADFNVIQTNLDITSITNAEIDTILAA